MKATTETASMSLDGEELTALARIDMDKGVLDQALIKLKQALAFDAKNVDALGMIARLYAQIGLLKKAQSMFERCLEINPDASLETFQYGMVQFDLGQKADALSTWTTLLAREPNHPPALFFKSVVLAESGRSAEARETADHILRTVSADNLYFGKAKELLRGIEAGTKVAARGVPSSYLSADKTTH